jgi:hypothetical protein
MTVVQLGTFAFDATPPVGHSCCGGWGGAACLPVATVADPLEALGVVIIPGPGLSPLVLMTLDWTGLANSAYAAMQAALAEGAGTTADRVSVHVLHPHNAPMACADAELLLMTHASPPPGYGEHPLDAEFYTRLLDSARLASAAAVAAATSVTSIGCGKAKVDSVASNRRIDIDPQTGQLISMRGSSCADPAVRAMTEGTIDPWLRTVTFFAESKNPGAQPRKLASLHYYATHPMSYYGDGVVTADFCGLARKQRQAEDPDCRHLYFNGCGGNVGAGKYNDGSPEMRPVLQVCGKYSVSL